MKIVVNGVERDTEAKTVQNLLDELGISEKVMAAAVNMIVVKNEAWCSFKLNENDKVEFLEFVGGG
jgi:sulfur carrier protein